MHMRTTFVALALIFAACDTQAPHDAGAPAPIAATGPLTASHLPTTKAVLHCSPVADGAQCTDLLTQAIDPGKDVTTGVSLPSGMGVVGPIRVTSDGFAVTGQTATPSDDGQTVWLSVTAHNSGSAEARFTAVLDYAAQ